MWSLDEIRSQWLKSLLTLAMGVLVALAARESGRLTMRTVLTTIFATLILFILIYDVHSVINYFRDGELPRRYGFLGFKGGPDKVSYIVIYAFTFVIVEIFFRLSYKKKYLMPNGIKGDLLLAASLLLTLFCTYVVGMRNGTLSALMLALFLMIVYVFRGSFSMKKGILFFMAMIIFAMAGFMNFNTLAYIKRHIQEKTNKGRIGRRSFFVCYISSGCGSLSTVTDKRPIRKRYCWSIWSRSTLSVVILIKRPTRRKQSRKEGKLPVLKKAFTDR